MSHLTLAYSSCPNDTFIFHALANRLVQRQGLDFKITMADVETLNQHAANSFFDITKLSFATFGALRDQYALLRTGAALGRGCGPLVVSLPGKMIKASGKPVTHAKAAKTESATSTLAPKEHTIAAECVRDRSIAKPVVAVPGAGTTAFVLFTLFINESFPDVEPEIVPMPFEKIMPAVRDGAVDFGVVIHEGRFIYQNLGLECLVDLGAWWESRHSLPIPLGCIAIKRAICQNKPDVASTVQRLIGQSIQYAFDHPQSSHEYIRAHAQELDDSVILKHINLYVNDFSKDIGIVGEAAIRTFFQKSEEAGIIKPNSEPLFASSI